VPEPPEPSPEPPAQGTGCLTPFLNWLPRRR